MRHRTMGFLVVALASISMPLAAQNTPQSARDSQPRVQRGPDASVRMQRGSRDARARMQRAPEAMRMQRGAMSMGRANGGAEFFLARTGELGLTDQQVVRLAAIARRTEARRVSQRESMAAMAPDMRMRARGTEMDSTAREARAQMMQRMRTQMTERRDAREAELRDALAVLTPEQQARAWQMNRRGRN